MLNACWRLALDALLPAGSHPLLALAVVPLLASDVGHRTSAQAHRLTSLPGPGPEALLLALGGFVVLFVAWRQNALRRHKRELRLVRQELLASEQRWQFALDGTADGVWDWDLATDQVVFTHRWKTMLGYGADEVGDTPEEWKSRIHPDDLSRVLAALEQHLGGRTMSYSSEHRVRCRDGSYRRVIERGRVVSRDSGERPLRVMGTLTDITARRTMEQQLRRYEREAQARGARQIEGLGALAGGLAHEFNNLLAGMLGPLSVARAGVAVDSQEGELLADVECAIRRAEERTRDLLVLAKGGTPVMVRTSLAALLQEAARHAESPCRLSLADDVLPVDGDVAQLEQLLASLLANAAQVSPAGSAVEVTAENVEDDDDRAGHGWVQVRIRDAGPGLPADDLPRVFEPFAATRSGGRGLGLAAAQAIVCAHGGSISADSAPGQGTTISFRLPAAPAMVPRPAPSATAPPAVDALPPSEKSEKASTPPARVLLIEDDDGVRSAMQRMLKRLGYAVEGVEDGRKGVAAYRQAREGGTPFDVVIADLTIPGGMGGREAVVELLAIDPSVRALVASGYSDDPVLARPADFGFSGVIQKPCDMATLGRVLRETLA